MTKKDLFIITLRLLGLFLLISSLFTTIPSILLMVSMENDISVILLSIASLLLILGLFSGIIFYTDRIVELFKLTKGLSNKEIDLKYLKSIHIFKVGIVLFGSYLILTNLTDFLAMSVSAFKSNIPGRSIERIDQGLNFNDYLYWTIYGLNILIGYIVISNVDKFSRFLDRRG